MQRHLERRSFLGGLCVAGVGLAGCSMVRGGSGTRLRIGTLQPPVTLDPIAAEYVGSERVVGLIFDGLYAYGPDGALRPRIAARPPDVTGDRAVRVELTEGARFQNGDPVTVEDVRYSAEAPRAEDTAAAADVSAVASVERVGDRTVRFALDHPMPDLGRLLTRPVVPKAVREADPEGFATEPVGAGPFELASFSEEKKARLTRWPEYWGEFTPPVEGVTVAYVESPFTGMMALTSNRTDVVTPVSPQLADRFRDVTGASVAARPSYWWFYFGFNLNEGPTTDPAVREAVARCIDLDTAVEEFIEPFGTRQYGPVPPSVAHEWGFPREAWRSQAPEKDVVAARRLFERADADVGRLTILTSKDPRWKELGERLAAGVRDAGRGARVASVSWKRYLDRYVTGSERDYAVFVGQVTGDADPDSLVYPAIHENVAGVTNGVFYREDSVMRRLLEARRTTDRARRRELYERAFERLLDDRVVVPICAIADSFAYDRPVERLRLHQIPRLNLRLDAPGYVRVGGGSR